MLGNLALMGMLVHEAHLPVLVANGIAIVCCSIVNFFLAHHWAFAVRFPSLPFPIDSRGSLITVPTPDESAPRQSNAR